MNLATVLVLVGTIFAGVSLVADARLLAAGTLLIGIGVLVGAGA